MDKPRYPQKNGADPKKDGFLRCEDVIEALCSGASMYYEPGSGNTCTVHRHVGRVRDDTLLQLLEDGWLESHANGGGFRISPEGHKAYLRSTDEMGDCVLRKPDSVDEQRVKP